MTLCFYPFTYAKLLHLELLESQDYEAQFAITKWQEDIKLSLSVRNRRNSIGATLPHKQNNSYFRLNKYQDGLNGCFR